VLVEYSGFKLARGDLIIMGACIGLIALVILSF
jgi:hypothetical protein